MCFLVEVFLALELGLLGSDGKASVYNAGDPGLISGLGRSPGEGNGNPFELSFHQSQWFVAALVMFPGG